MLPDEITTKLDHEREERRKHIARIYAISGEHAPVIDPNEMFLLASEWRPSRIEGLESRCIFHDESSSIHHVRAIEAGTIREHRHREGQYMQVLRGLVRARKGAELRIMHAGDWMFIEPNTPHRMTWGGDAEILKVFSRDLGC